MDSEILESQALETNKITTIIEQIEALKKQEKLKEAISLAVETLGLNISKEPLKFPLITHELVDSNPYVIDLISELVGILVKVQTLGVAKIITRETLAIVPDHVILKSRLIEIFIKLRLVNEAKKTNIDALNSHPDNKVFVSQMAKILKIEKKFSKAERLILKSLGLNLTSTGPLITRELLDDHANNCCLISQLIDVLEKQNKLEMAEKIAREAAYLKPDNEFFINQLGTILMSEHRYEEAKKAAYDILKLNGNKKAIKKIMTKIKKELAAAQIEDAFYTQEYEKQMAEQALVQSFFQDDKIENIQQLIKENPNNLIYQFRLLILQYELGLVVIANKTCKSIINGEGISKEKLSVFKELLMLFKSEKMMHNIRQQKVRELYLKLITSNENDQEYTIKPVKDIS